MSEPETYDYILPIQKNIVAMLLYDKRAFVENVEYIKPKYFTDPVLQDIVSIIEDFYKKFPRPPSEDEFLEEYKLFMSLEKNKNLDADKYTKIVTEVMKIGRKKAYGEYEQRKVVMFAKYMVAQEALLTGARKRMPKLDVEGIIGDLEKALLVGEQQSSLGSFYIESLEERIEKRVERTRRDLAIPTNLEKLNSILGGGIVPPELGIFMGPMKRGKTAVAVNAGKGALVHGYGVVHYCLESTEEEAQFLYDLSVSGIDKDEINIEDIGQRRKKLMEMKNAVKNFFGEYTGVGRLLVKEFSECTALAIETHLNKLKIMEDFKPDLLIIDYLGLMKCSDKNIKFEGSSGGKYFMLGEIVKELLRMAKRRQCAIWLLHQTTRKSFQKLRIDMDDSGDSLIPMQDAHIIITINPENIVGEEGKKLTDKEVREKLTESEDKPLVEMRLFVAGGRSVPDRRWVTYMFDKKRCQTYTRGEDI